MTSRLAFPSSLLATTLSFALFERSAAAEPACHRDTHCSGAQICSDGECTSEGARACQADSECRGDDWLRNRCVEGTCKSNEVRCDNPAGSCIHADTSPSCSCADGSGGSGGWDGGEIPERTDAELYQLCVAALESWCGTEAPTCTDDQRSTCTDYLGVIATWERACGADVGDPTERDILGCCNGDAGGWAAEVLECSAQHDPNDCQGFAENCLGEGEGEGGREGDGAGTGNPTTGGAGQDESAGDDQKGCTIGGEFDRHASILLGLLLIGLARQRSRSG